MSTVAIHHNAEADYVLPRDEVERTRQESFAVYELRPEFDHPHRLNEQQLYVSICMCEGRLIYDQSVHLSPGSQVLESATGTGAWLLALSKEVPTSVKLHGCDISPNNFPNAHPDNVQFQVAPATSLPSDWSNKFDFAHQRLLTAGLPGPDWPTAVSELFRVVKPGGHIQLLEVDFSNIVNAGPSTVRAYSLLSDLFDKRRLLFDCSKHLQRFAEAAGFVDVKSDKGYWAMGKKAWGGIGELGTKDMRLILRGMAPSLKMEGVIRSEQEMYDLVDECAKEWDESDYGFRLASHILCARKPE